MWLIRSGENLRLGSVMGLSQVWCEPGSAKASQQPVLLLELWEWCSGKWPRRGQCLSRLKAQKLSSRM